MMVGFPKTRLETSQAAAHAINSTLFLTLATAFPDHALGFAL